MADIGGHFLCSFHSSLEDAMQLKLRHSAPLEMRLCMVSFFKFLAETMDYSKAFWLNLRPYFVVVLLHAGKCYDEKTCAICSP